VGEAVDLYVGSEQGTLLRILPSCHFLAAGYCPHVG
jgi:hypothetical protein